MAFAVFIVSSLWHACWSSRSGRSVPLRDIVAGASCSGRVVAGASCSGRVVAGASCSGMSPAARSSTWTRRFAPLFGGELPAALASGGQAAAPGGGQVFDLDQALRALFLVGSCLRRLPPAARPPRLEAAWSSTWTRRFAPYFWGELPAPLASGGLVFDLDQALRTLFFGGVACGAVSSTRPPAIWRGWS